LLLPTGGLAIWRADEYMLNFLFSIWLQFQPTNNADLQFLSSTFVTLLSSGSGLDDFQMPPHRQTVPLCVMYRNILLSK
jgi:hypothetical protein